MTALPPELTATLTTDLAERDARVRQQERDRIVALLRSEAVVEAVASSIVPSVYESYRLGRYGSQEYLPMWHEVKSDDPRVSTKVPEVQSATTAALAEVARQIEGAA